MDSTQFVIRDLESLMAFGDLSGEKVSRITRLTIENYDDIAKSKLFNFGFFEANQGITLEFIDSQFPLERFLDERLKLKTGVVTTIRYKFTREYQRPINVLNPPFGKDLPCERLIVDFGAKIDCRGLRVQNLVLYNMLSATHLSETEFVKTLVIVHSFNIVQDSLDADKTFPLPNIPSVKTLVIPESQEFSYEVGKTSIPDIVGVIPSSYYPSRFVAGVQQAREPFTKSQLPDIVYEVFAVSNS